MCERNLTLIISPFNTHNFFPFSFFLFSFSRFSLPLSRELSRSHRKTIEEENPIWQSPCAVKSSAPCEPRGGESFFFFLLLKTTRGSGGGGGQEGSSPPTSTKESRSLPATLSGISRITSPLSSRMHHRGDRNASCRRGGAGPGFSFFWLAEALPNEKKRRNMLTVNLLFLQKNHTDIASPSPSRPWRQSGRATVTPPWPRFWRRRL